MWHITKDRSRLRAVHQSEKTDHLRAKRCLVDGALACKIVLATLAGAVKVPIEWQM